MSNVKMSYQVCVTQTTNLEITQMQTAYLTELNQLQFCRYMLDCIKLQPFVQGLNNTQIIASFQQYLFLYFIRFDFPSVQGPFSTMGPLICMLRT